VPDSFHLERIKLETAVLGLSLVPALTLDFALALGPAPIMISALGMLHRLPALLVSLLRHARIRAGLGAA